jgi:hypothetical protein
VSGCTIDEADVECLAKLAGVLIPASAAMPAADAVPGIRDALRVAAKACGYREADIRAALKLIDADIDWPGANALAAAQPEAFAILGTLTSAAYYMTPDVLALLKFPTERRNPADMEEFVSEYETGILDPVTERGPRFRHPTAA